MPVLKYVDGVWTTHGGPEGERGLPGLQGAQGPVNPLNVGRNRALNGDFSVNQRGFTSTAITDTYGFDRWIIRNFGGTIAYSAQVPATGELPESATNYARVTVSGHASTNDYAHLIQRVEGVRTLSGKTATISFWAKASSSALKTTASFLMGMGTGGGQTSNTAIVGPAIPLTTTWARYSVTLSIPSLAGMGIGALGNDYLGVILWASAGSATSATAIGLQSGTFDFWGVQAEEGPVATLFETKTYDEQLRACQRYFQRLHQLSLKGQAGAAEYCTRMSMPLPVHMYKVPTVSVGGTLYVWDGFQGSTYTSISENYSTAQTIEVQMHTATSFTAVGRSIVGYQSGVFGYMDLNAEIL